MTPEEVKGMLPVMQDYVAGKTLQWKPKSASEAHWQDYDGRSRGDQSGNALEWRTKPEPPPATPKPKEWWACLNCRRIGATEVGNPAKCWDCLTPLTLVREALPDGPAAPATTDTAQVSMLKLLNARQLERIKELEGALRPFANLSIQEMHTAISLVRQAAEVLNRGKEDNQ